MKTYIFDLDHTVIDSSHRQLTKADGSLDLAHWIENNTPEKIAADTELPLANHWRKVQRARIMLPLLFAPLALSVRPIWRG
jgi:FMN phosphatase YigB (HAD superfamily)